jgi:hypothetical protein
MHSGSIARAASFLPMFSASKPNNVTIYSVLFFALSLSPQINMVGVNSNCGLTINADTFL